MKRLAVRPAGSENADVEETMNLTKAQIEAAEQGESVGIQVDGTELVLIRKDVYEKL